VWRAVPKIYPGQTHIFKCHEIDTCGRDEQDILSPEIGINPPISSV
jgi:hypothetical protein